MIFSILSFTWNKVLKSSKFFLFFTVFVSISIYISSIIDLSNDPIKNNDDKYIISSSNPNFISKIATLITKPIIEEYLDSRIEKGGIVNYIEKKNFFNKAITISDIKEGSGMPIICGQKVRISYYSKKNKLITKTITVGNHDDKLINVGIIGMKNGGKRLIKFKDDFVVDLLEVLENYPDDINKIKIFSKIDITKKAYMCGDELDLHILIRDIKSYNSVFEYYGKFKIGSNSLPIGIEQGLIGIQEDDLRYIILSKDLLKTSKKTDNFDYNKEIEDKLSENFYIVELSTN